MDRETARKKITNLREEIEYHNKLYYDDNENIISDYDYDLKMNELISLEKESVSDAFLNNCKIHYQ